MKLRKLMLAACAGAALMALTGCMATSGGRSALTLNGDLSGVRTMRIEVYPSSMEQVNGGAGRLSEVLRAACPGELSMNVSEDGLTYDLELHFANLADYSGKARALLRRGMTDEQINARLQENGAADLIQCTQLEDGGIVYQEFFNSEELVKPWAEQAMEQSGAVSGEKLKDLSLTMSWDDTVTYLGRSMKEAGAIKNYSMLKIDTTAYGWLTNEQGQWMYRQDDAKGEYYKNSWQWIVRDVNESDPSKSMYACYYFDENGIMLANTTTPDGYQVNEKGEWVENGVVRLKDQATVNTEQMAKFDESIKQAEQALQDSLRKCSDDISAYAGEYTDGIFWNPSYSRLFPMGSNWKMTIEGNHVTVRGEGLDNAGLENRSFYVESKGERDEDGTLRFASTTYGNMALIVSTNTLYGPMVSTYVFTDANWSSTNSIYEFYVNIDENGRVTSK